MRFSFHLLIHVVGEKIQYNPELFLFFTNIASLFISLVKQEKVVEMDIYDGILKAMQAKA
jgi:hypothetical protein